MRIYVAYHVKGWISPKWTTLGRNAPRTVNEMNTLISDLAALEGLATVGEITVINIIELED